MCIRDRDLANQDGFGRAVALDGTTAVVGAASHDGGAQDAGAAYVFEDTGGSWQQVAKLISLDLEDDDRFGFSVAVSGDRVVVGAPGEDSLGFGAGAAYVFEDQGAGWVQTAKLTAGDGAASDQFGTAVDVDGDRIVVGAIFGEEFAFNPEVGTVYVYEHDGAAWNETAEIADTSAGQLGDSFGSSLALQGTRLVVGSPHAHNGGTCRGRATVHELQAGSWSLEQRFEVSGIDPNFLHYGTGVALDGDRLLVSSPVGGPGAGFVPTGMVDVWEKPGSFWTRTARLAPDVTNPIGQGFGVSVALEGDTILVGSDDFDAHADGQGAVHLFRPSPAGDWLLLSLLSPADAANGDLFGKAIDVSGGVALIGLPGDDDQAPGAGSAAVWDVQVSCCPDLYGTPAHLSIFGNDESQSLVVEVGAGFAGDFFFVLGSLSGTSPGVPIDASLTLPLNPDAYLNLLLPAPGAPIGPATGFLDGQGQAALQFDLPGNLPLNAAGLQANHAVIVFDATTLLPVHVTSPWPVSVIG